MYFCVTEWRTYIFVSMPYRRNDSVVKRIKRWSRVGAAKRKSTADCKRQLCCMPEKRRTQSTSTKSGEKRKNNNEPLTKELHLAVIRFWNVKSKKRKKKREKKIAVHILLLAARKQYNFSPFEFLNHSLFSFLNNWIVFVVRFLNATQFYFPCSTTSLSHTLGNFGFIYI